MVINVLHIGLNIQKVLGWRRVFTTGADRINVFRVHRQRGFQSDIAYPVGIIVIDVAKPLALAKLELTQRDTPRIRSASAVVFTIDMEVIEVLVVPCKENLNDIVKLIQRGDVMYQNPTPDQGLMPRRTMRS